MLRKKITFLLILFLSQITCRGQRWWNVTDGLLNSEVQQIVCLPNGQMLVNCEGGFCLSNGKGFVSVPCDRQSTFTPEHYIKGYSSWWQGDTLLWLRDYYRIYLFDTRTSSFRYDIEKRLSNPSVRQFTNGELEQHIDISSDIKSKLDSLDVTYNLTETATDHQGGIWIGTRNNGIYYIPAIHNHVDIVKDDRQLIEQARSYHDSKGKTWSCRSNGLYCDDIRYDSINVKGLNSNNMTFITELPDHRFLLCHSLNQLGYFNPEKMLFEQLNPQLPQLNEYRHMIGAQVTDNDHVLVYTQNGIFLLNTKTNKTEQFPASRFIESYSDKYNCILMDSSGSLWIGTQNGLFKVSPNFYEAELIEGIQNSCIRSLLVDKEGHVWAGTSSGISRITPSVINFGVDDGIPNVSMMERAASVLPDGKLLFLQSSHAILFYPKDLTVNSESANVVITQIIIQGQHQFYEKGKSYEFPYNENNISFQFSALNYARPSHTRYEYRLLPVEKEWQPCVESDGSMGEVQYRSLSPGNYQFEVRAAIDDGQWSESVRYVFEVLPPWWLSWWAKLIYGICAVSLLCFLIYLYLKRKRSILEKENDERVNRLFELREEARHQFAVSTAVNPQNIGVNAEEEQLVEKMLKSIEANMENTDYGVDQLASDVAMSRSLLYDKLRNMLGITPSDFIRNVRLKRAAKLLTESPLSIMEISERVGFGSPRLFSSHFKKMFGILPSAYRDSIHKGKEK